MCCLGRARPTKTGPTKNPTFSPPQGAPFFAGVLSWLSAHNGWAGWGIFVASYAAAVSLLLPGVAGPVAAGFVFGFPRGLLAAWLGAAAGTAAAFLLARYLVGAALARAMRGRSRTWAALDTALALEGWPLFLVLRLSPLIPYNMLNLAAASTSVPFLAFAGASAVGMVPEMAGAKKSGVERGGDGVAVPTLTPHPLFLQS